MKKLAPLAIALVVTACTVQQDPAPTTTSKPKTPAPAGSMDKPGGNTPTKPGDNTTMTPDKPADGPTRTGVISLTQTVIKAGATTINTYSAIASFSEVAASTGTGTENPCKTSMEGTCSITECTTPQGGTQTGGNPTATKAPDAGEITIAGSTTVKLDAAADTGAYKPGSGQVELFAAGADISVKAAGATVPAFDQKVVGPGQITVTSTWPAAGTAFDVDRTKDINLVWTGGTAGDVTASLVSNASGKTGTVSCKFPAADGKGTIPAAALAKLVVTAQGAISVSASNTNDFTQGDWKITLSALSPGKAGASSASGLANIH
jgi:hypothetical protein